MLYLVMTLVFTYPSGRGSMLHSGIAMLPWLAIAAVVGLEVAVHWVAARLPHWNAPKATRNFTVIFAGISALLCVYLTQEQVGEWHKQIDGYAAVAPYVRSPNPVVMALNPPAWWFLTRQPAIQTPSNGPDAALAAAQRYGATHLIIEPARPAAWRNFDVAQTGDPRFYLVTEQAGFALLELRY
jgi:hypothetical protein